MDGHKTSEYTIEINNKLSVGLFFVNNEGECIEKPYITLTQLKNVLSTVKMIYSCGCVLNVDEYINDSVEVMMVYEKEYRKTLDGHIILYLSLTI